MKAPSGMTQKKAYEGMKVKILGYNAIYNGAIGVIRSAQDYRAAVEIGIKVEELKDFAPGELVPITWFEWKYLEPLKTQQQSVEKESAPLPMHIYEDCPHCGEGFMVKVEVLPCKPK